MNAGSLAATITRIAKAPNMRAQYTATFADGRTYVFIAGTIGAPRGPVEVGRKGLVEYRVGPSSGLWYWSDLA